LLCCPTSESVVSDARSQPAKAELEHDIVRRCLAGAIQIDREKRTADRTKRLEHKAKEACHEPHCINHADDYVGRGRRFEDARLPIGGRNPSSGPSKGRSRLRRQRIARFHSPYSRRIKPALEHLPTLCRLNTCSIFVSITKGAAPKLSACSKRSRTFNGRCRANQDFHS
jgi:hypothetical protein